MMGATHIQSSHETKIMPFMQRFLKRGSDTRRITSISIITIVQFTSEWQGTSSGKIRLFYRINNRIPIN